MMKTIVKVAAGIVITFLLTINLNAQDIDRDRMNRDLEVAENILSTLGKQNFGGSGKEYLFYGSDVRGNYIDGYGVVFNLPADFSSYNIIVSDPGQRIVINDGRGNSSYSYNYGDTDIEVDVDPDVDIDFSSNESKEATIDLMKSFLVDYADLIGQLKPSDKIMLAEEKNDFVWNVRLFDDSDNHSSKTRITAEILKSDITKYKEGKLSREEALDKVKVVDKAKDHKKYPDLELLASIFDRLYREDLSDSYHLNGKVRFEKIDDLGAIFSMKLHRHDRDGRGFLRGYSNAKSNEEDERLYPPFLEELKRNVLEYGRTVKSINEKEQLFVKVEMEHCSNCTIPSELEVAVAGSVLADYSSGQISLENAVQKLKVSESNN